MESGAYEIQIGENAQDIVLSSRVTVNSVTDIPKVYTRNSTIGEILADTNGKEIFQKTMAQMLGDNAQLLLLFQVWFQELPENLVIMPGQSRFQCFLSLTAPLVPE